ncbi:MAG: ribonuclease H-like domain-containing protein [Thermodesulfobacteriota bacterium]
MLQNSFLHIPGIGLKTEEKLWQAGLTEWRQAVVPGGFPIPVRKRLLFTDCLHESMDQLRNRNLLFFERRMPSFAHWRFFMEFREETAFLDIETDGLDSENGMITTIALYDGRRLRHYVNGHNLEAFPGDLRGYKLLVTYNGKCFDIPFIERYFRIRIHQAQIDLRHVLAGLGFKGGLKRCEAALGIHRGVLKDVDGWIAPLLFQEYRRNRNAAALETLLAYNMADAINLEALMVIAHNRHIEGTPFVLTHRIPEPTRPQNPFQADRRIIETIQSRNVSGWA